MLEVGNEKPHSNVVAPCQSGRSARILSAPLERLGLDIVVSRWMFTPIGMALGPGQGVAVLSMRRGDVFVEFGQRIASIDDGYIRIADRITGEGAVQSFGMDGWAVAPADAPSERIMQRLVLEEEALRLVRYGIVHAPRGVPAYLANDDRAEEPRKIGQDHGPTNWVTGVAVIGPGVEAGLISTFLPEKGKKPPRANRAPSKRKAAGKMAKKKAKTKASARPAKGAKAPKAKKKSKAKAAGSAKKASKISALRKVGRRAQ